MRYLCLIYLNEAELAGIPAPEMSALNARHLDLNDDLRKRGNFIVAEALDPASSSTCVRIKDGRTVVTDGPYAESKEVVAGFYLIEAADMKEAAAIAARIPSSSMGTIEVRPARQLHVEGRAPRWG